MSSRRKPLSQITNREMNRKRNNNNTSGEAPQKKIRRNNAVAQRAGTILHMTLKNFMCHSHLDVEFDQNINYIIGRNGSGKSAILTALVVGLGARASVTNRGTSIKGFIKAGESSGSVEIVLSNEGSMAYKPQIYGHTISVYRHVNVNGSSSYLIKAATGKTIATSAKEINNITSKLCIQIDNPVCILNQDTSRNFLSSSDPKAKFILFNKATRLEILYEEYKLFAHNKKKASIAYQGKQQILDKLIKDVNELHRKIANHRNIQTKIEELQKLQVEMLWRKVQDSESEFKQHEKSYESLMVSHSDLQGNTVNREQRIKEIVASVSSYTQQLNEIQAESEVQKTKKGAILAKIDALKRAMGQNKMDRSTYGRDLKNKENDCATIETEIANFTQRLTAIEQQKLDHLRKTADLEKNLNKFQGLVDTYQNDIFQQTGDIKKKEDEMNQSQRELNDANTQLNNNKQHYRTLKNETNNKLAAYGRDMQNLVNAVEASKNRFSEMPRGPLGSYISVKDRKWSVAIEGYLGKATLQAFFVNNSKDATILMQLMQQNWHDGPKPQIITSKFIHKVHNVSANLVQQIDGCVSIFEAISVSDPVVMNRIIDDSRIEGILLIPGDDQAVEMMSNARNVPRHCTQAVSIRGDKYYPDPSYKFYGSKYHQARYLQIDRNVVIRQLEETITRLTGEVGHFQEKYNEIKKDVDASNRIVQDLHTKMQKCKTGAQLARRRLVELQSTEETESGNVHQLETELSDIRRQINVQNGKIESNGAEMIRISEQLKEAGEELRRINEIGDALQERTLPIEDQVREQFLKRQEINTNDDFDKKRIAESKRRMDMAKTDMARFQSIYKVYLEQATAVAPKPETTLKDMQTLSQKISEGQRRIKVMQAESEDPLKLKEKYKEKSSICDKTKEILEIVGHEITQLNMAYEKRKKRCRNTRDYFENFVNHCFSNYLKARQFKGSLNINFDDRTLDMVVVPQQGSQGVTATSNLSGGERSFSTVGFLYSLWQCLDFPFYFLDEFDVFMDKFNRTAVMEILIQHAKSRPEVQFVFLTPQDVSFINDDQVAIHRLEDPERRALTQ